MLRYGLTSSAEPKGTHRTTSTSLSTGTIAEQDHKSGSRTTSNQPGITLPPSEKIPAQPTTAHFISILTLMT
jgi:hypothetical protein